MATKRAAAVMNARRARPLRRAPTLKKRIKTFIALFFLAALSVVAAVAIFVIIKIAQIKQTIPSVAEIGNFQPSDGTRIYTSDGELLAILAAEHRRPVKLPDVSKHLIDATIATEDSRFYEHRGIDYHGVVRAVLHNIGGGGEAKEGASTITQQLARNINELGIGRKKTFERKIAEALTAVRIEQTFNKEEILELYLNQIYYGAGAYGVEAAAQTYFHKSASKLTLAEASLLAGLPKSPSYYSDPRHRESAIRRQETVLQRMVETDKITPADRDKALAETLKIYKPEPSGTRIFGSPYLVNYAISQLANEHNGRVGFGSEAIYGGWKIVLTINSQIQKLAEDTLREGVHHYGENANQGALICEDTHTGEIRAMVGGLDYKRTQYNAIVQGARQPGSAFKPIVYAAALDTEVADLDKTYRDDPDIQGVHLGKRANGEVWRPKNYSGKYSYRSVTVLSAIKQSLNTVAVKAAVDAGLDNVISYAHRMGITAHFDAVPPIALGAVAVRPIEICSAYTVFANGGRRPIPYIIKEVSAPNGDVIEQAEPKEDNTGLKQSTIEQMDRALQEVVLHGTGTMAADVPNAHGKTGTTSAARDAWFIGYTPELTTAIWVCSENRFESGPKKGKLNPKEPYKEMGSSTGGHVCAPIWRDFMLKAVPIQQKVNAALSAPAPRPAQPEATAENEKPRTKKTDKKENPAQPASPLASQPAENPDGTPAENPATVPAPGPAAPPETAAPQDTPPVVNRPAPARAEAFAPKPSAPAVVRHDPGDDMVTVRLCADSMRRATDYCEATIERRMRRKEVPGRCRIHKPPPGEGQ